jgi:hypothetical protein
MSANWKDGRRPPPKPLSAPRNIIHEVPYRDYRIVLTDDNALVGQQYPDKWGFTTDRGFVVLDSFDEHVFPAGVHWFYTPEDAVAAIEMLDTVLPTIKEAHPSTHTYEYGVMRSYRREFWQVFLALVKIQHAVDEASQFDENPAVAIREILHTLRQNVAQGRSIG